ncbi:gp19 tail tube protein [Acinetobacter phage Acj9]|uniref:Gp19 tail tube protein n=1 Tax=Acinetobacter phage Acj9 TaxID=760939 RepID=E5EPW3_9CAUD|nr:gp19 tail tube protein [Acinetobacter phage Acj9]ADG60079.1 gp19 tail tube protein [Acinetobacter phage Acj9]
MELTDILRAFESGDFARPNLFLVELPYLGQNFSFKCKAAPIPPATVDQIPVGFQNKKIKVAGDRTFDDWTITIYGDDAHETRQQMLDWQNICHAQGPEITGGKPSEYKKTATVKQYARDGKTVSKEHTLYGIWPTLVGEIALDWDTNNEVETFETTFAVDYHL